MFIVKIFPDVSPFFARKECLNYYQMLPHLDLSYPARSSKETKYTYVS
jgi:hypothetical protein